MRASAAGILLVLLLLIGCQSDSSEQAGPPAPPESESAAADATAAEHHQLHSHGDGFAHSHADAAAGHTHHEEADHAHLHPAHDPQAPCTCDAAALSNVWCRRCNVGYVAGQRVENALLFETLDAHGHFINMDAIECPSCQLALRQNGFCETCNMGFVDGRTYFSRLTHGLALGQFEAEADAPACTHIPGAGEAWCDICKVGRVGNVFFADQATHARTSAEFDNFLKAIDRAQTCELCACAMVVHRTCPRCLISYEVVQSASGSGSSGGG